jgi:GAF domain-containing protein
VSGSHEDGLAEAFVELTDTLVADFDVVEFLHVLAGRCVELLSVQAAGVMVADQRGSLRVMASSSEQARLLELFEVEADEGPCVDCYLTRTPSADLDLDTPDPRWRSFAKRARDAGFRSVHAVPVRLRDEVIGVLNLFAEAPGALSDIDARAARGLANVATMGLLQHRAVEYRQVLAEQLQHAMNARVVIDQARGILAEHLDMDMGAAFAELRRYARRTGRRLSDMATDVTAGDYLPTARELPAGRVRVLLIRRFDLSTMQQLRTETYAAGIRQRASVAALFPFILAVHEAVANAVRHGGGNGRLILWRQDDSLYAEISDHGTGIPADRLSSPEPPDEDTRGGRGLWLIEHFCPAVEIDTGPAGTRLLLRYPLDSPALDSAP